MATKLQMLGDIDMNAKDIHDAGVKLDTYIYDESLSPATQFKWYRIEPPTGVGESDRYLISIEGDANYSWQRGTYILDISTYVNDAHGLSLVNLGTTDSYDNMGSHLLAVGIDHHGCVYVQTKPAWANHQLRISRIMMWGAYNTGVSQTYSNVGHAAFGVADGFDSLGIILDSGCLRIVNGALETSTSNMSRTIHYSDMFACHGGGNTYTFGVAPANGRAQLNRNNGSVIEFQDDKMITGCDLVNRWQNNLGNSAFPWGTVTAKQLVLGWTTLDETALQKLLAGGGGSSLGHTLRIAYSDNNYDLMILKSDGSVEYRTVESGGSAKITDVVAVYGASADGIPVAPSVGIILYNEPWTGIFLANGNELYPSMTLYGDSFFMLLTDAQVYLQI